MARQVVTDEDGIGILNLTSTDIENIENDVNGNIIKVSAKDMNNNTVEKSIPVIISDYSGTIVTLDKVKYNANEDITMHLASTTDAKNKEILIYKNKDLLKIIDADTDEVTVNLEDTYGIIDIYTKKQYVRPRYDYYTNTTTMIDTAEAFISNSPTYNSSSYYAKKTIFIKPDKALNLQVETSKDEYKPGEKLSVDFTSKTENGEIIDSALLVSILDEAILSLADNDLSIDNIKLALQDIELGEGITAADLYAEILDEKAENKLRVALLRQKTTSPNITQVTNDYYFSEEQAEYLGKAVLSGIAFALIIFIVLMKKFPKFRIIVMSLINIAVIFMLLYMCFYEFLYFEIDLEGIGLVITLAIVTLIIYALVLYKYKIQIFNAIIKMILIPFAYFIPLTIIYEMSYNDIIMNVGVLLPAIVMTILIVVSRKYKLNNFWNKFKELTIIGVKAQVIYFLGAMFMLIVKNDTPATFIIVTIILYWISEFIYAKKHKTKIVDGKITLEINSALALGFACGIIIFALYGLYVYNSPKNYMTDDLLSQPSLEMNDAYKGDIQTISPSQSDSAGLDFNMFDNVLSSTGSNKSDVLEEAEENMAISQEESTENSEKIEENVRNIFLESLAFIPELETKGGQVEAQLPLSDNITTWNIQAIGNTKDGRVGFNTSTFKVFKDFFIDFSLPTNSVVTDKTNIPVTVYNYTDKELAVNLTVKENDWSTIGNYTNSVNVPANSTKMIYIPIELIKAGTNILRIESSANGVSDIVEKTLVVNPNGFKKEAVISSGSTEKDLSLDHFTTEKAIENTRKLKVKLYPSVISQTIEGMENIFRMPTGCFEQTSSSLYPNILALKYLEDTGLDDTDIKEKALEYISKGYQRILTFETNTKGGYSLYGDDPAENVLTAFGLMELTDLQSVYEIDEQVTKNMADYLFSEQKINGTFDIGSTYIGDASSDDDLAMNAYIIWALSEACPDDSRLQTSIDYLEGKIDKATDNYTLALMANAFANVNSKSAKTVISKLMEDVQEDNEGGAYISSGIRDYWGSYGRYQDVQTTALASMALTKEKVHTATNNAFLAHIIKNKDAYGTWSTTQSTILALKAINSVNTNADISNQKIKVAINDNTKEIEIKDDILDFYEVEFDNIKDENKISIDMEKGNIYYEITEEYYVGYETLDEEALSSASRLAVMQTITPSVKVNETIGQLVTVANLTNDIIRNGLVQIYIPQGCSVLEESLAKIVHDGYIEKYEYNYNTINLYFRNMNPQTHINLDIKYRANYPEQITGGLVRAYDYYNPSNEGHAKPINITVNE